MSENPIIQYKAKDFASDQDVRWCPGCGDYAILKSVQKTMPELGVDKKDIVFVSGIGCSSRFPYYMDTYGFHSIHGRAPAIATGVKLANPKLSVWQITGDGDALAIGGNHFIHAMRRNIDINILLFNNRIYGLTKGQFSPTTNLGQKTKTSPLGSIDNPFNPGELALGAKAQFFARIEDINPKGMTEVFLEAAKHKGTSLVEILQNCVIFNDKIYKDYTAKEVKAETFLRLEHGKPMIFGKDNEKGIRLNGLKLEVVEIGKDNITESDLLVHDAKEEDITLHMMLVNLEMPMVTGVIRSVEHESFEDRMAAQVEYVRKTTKFKTVDDLLGSGETWEIE
tara:strand:- start:94048 stop:95061 length:1014 start_codon:yes stop_codon:yes gene_type:complete